MKRLRRISDNHIGFTVSGCLGRCGEGPCLVIYPSGIWFRYDSKDDIDKILQSYVGGKPVPRRLMLDNGGAGKP